jgi:plasmid replication initiation protein
MQRLGNFLEQFPTLRQKAAEAEQRRHARDKAQAECKAVLLQIAQLPLWDDELRCLPNEIARSALFNARNRKQARAYLKQAEIIVIGEGRITYTGEELRQDDQTVWLQLIHMAKEQPLGQTIEFTAYSFCKAIGWPIDGRSYTRLRGCLVRMQATSLAAHVQRRETRVSQRVCLSVSLSMIPLFRWRDDETRLALRLYQVQIAPQLVELFGNNYYTRIEWAQRLALPDGIATWLHGYFASHKNNYAIFLDTIKQGAGITIKRTDHLKKHIEQALNALIRVGFLKSWEIVDEKVRVVRANHEKDHRKK